VNNSKKIIKKEAMMIILVAFLAFLIFLNPNQTLEQIVIMVVAFLVGLGTEINKNGNK